MAKEEFKEKYSHDNLAMHFWDGVFEDKKLSLAENEKTCRESIEHCLLRALKDFTDRTETKTEEYKDTTVSAEDKLKMLKDDKFEEKFIDYFTTSPAKTEKEFDKWHHELCDQFLYVFNKKEKVYDNLKYGKAQKIVNMTFKQIYCLVGAEDYEKNGYFKYCHMPLDSLTLEWLYRAGQKQPDIKIGGKRVTREYPSWSNLEWAPSYKINVNGKFDDNGKYTYMAIQEWIREYFKRTETDWTPFTAEFVIWPQIQTELAAEGLYGQLLKLDASNCTADMKTFKSENMSKKIEFLQNEIMKIDCSFIKTDFKTDRSANE